MAPRRSKRGPKRKSSSSSDEKPSRRARANKPKRKHSSSSSSESDSDSDKSTSGTESKASVERKCDHIITPLPVSHEEKMLYKEMFSDISDVPKDKLYCTACRKNLSKMVMTKNADKMFPHPVLGVLLCKDCYSFYGEGFLEDDGDGNDAYCRWCAQGGNLFCCSTCNCAFCKACVKSNFERPIIKEIQESEDWLCFACDPKHLLNLRAVCSTIFESFRSQRKQSLDARMKELCEKKSHPSPRSVRVRARLANGKPKSKNSSEASGSGSDSSEETDEDAVPDWLRECMLDAIHITGILSRVARKIRNKHNPAKGQEGISKTVRNLSKLAAIMKENGNTLERNVDLNFIGAQVQSEGESKVIENGELQESKSGEDVKVDIKETANEDVVNPVNESENGENKLMVTNDLDKEINNKDVSGIITECETVQNIEANTGMEHNGDVLSDEELDSVSTLIIGKANKISDENGCNITETVGEANGIVNESVEKENCITLEPDIFDLYDDEPLATPCAPSPVPSVVSEEEDISGRGGNDDVDCRDISVLHMSVASLDAPTEIIVDGTSPPLAEISDIKSEIISNSDCDLLNEIQTAKRDVLASSSSDESEDERSERLRKRKAVDYSINEVESDDERKTSRTRRKQRKDKKESKSQTIVKKDLNHVEPESMFDMSCDEVDEDIEEEVEDDDIRKRSDDEQGVKGDKKILAKNNKKNEMDDAEELKKDNLADRQTNNSQDSGSTFFENVSANGENLNERKGNIGTGIEQKKKVDVKTLKDAHKQQTSIKKDSASSCSSLSDNSDIEFCEPKLRRKRKKRASFGDAECQQVDKKDDTTEKVEKTKSIDDDIKRLSNLRNFRVTRRAKSENGSSDTEENDSEGEENKEKKQEKVDKEEKGSEDEGQVKKKNKKIGNDIHRQKKSLIEYLNVLSSNDEGDDASSESESKDHESVKKKVIATRNSIATRNELAKKLLFKSSSGSERENSDDGLIEKIGSKGAQKKKRERKKKEKVEEKSEKEKNEGEEDAEEEEDKEDAEEKAAKSKWRKSKLLTCKLSETDSEEEERKFLKRKLKEEEKKSKGRKEDHGDTNSDSDFEDLYKKKRKSGKKSRKRLADSDSDVCVLSSSSEDASSSESDKRKKKSKKRGRSSDSSILWDSSGSEKKKKKRKRIKVMSDGSKSSDEAEEDIPDSQKTDTPGKGRKNIRKLITKDELGKRTKMAAKEEEERKRRIAERQKLYNQVFEISDKPGTEKLERLVLDFNPETKEELVAVDTKLVEKLKPHQAKGIKFMWEACFESLEQIKEGHTSGCILAHCMGLGKTLQVIALVHTLLKIEETGVNSVLVVCPLNTVLNWRNEFKYWLRDVDDSDDIDVYELTTEKQNFARAYKLSHWQKTGGVMILGYEMYRNLTSTTRKRIAKKHVELIQTALVDPGPDMIVCDEGHLLKNASSALSKALSQVTTLRRIVLTGTPLQNNLKEYHCMISFVKPDLLGTIREFQNRFLNPIMNGQHADSTQLDVRIMKRRAHVLHKMLDGCVQRYDYNVLTPFLPPKHEYVVCISLSPLQVKLYQHYIEHFARNRTIVGGRGGGAGARLFSDFHALQRIWTHPYVLKLSAVQEEYKKMMADESDSEGSLKDFIDDGDDSDASSNSETKKKLSSNSEDEVVCLEDQGESKKKAENTEENNDKKKETKKEKKDDEDDDADEVINKWKSSTRGREGEEVEEEQPDTRGPTKWWSEFVSEEDLENINHSGKLCLLFTILKECELIGDKVLVFSHSLFSLNVIEHFLNRVDEATQNITQDSAVSSNVGSFLGSWCKGLDYFRIDGSTASETRSHNCSMFNSEDNHRARLFLISTKAGGLGINLTGANRVVIFDASWNPSHDVQSIFRIYRFGQKKPCYIYRFLAEGTMEEKIYDRQVTKLSLACRVVDEQQIERHFNQADLNALYEFNPTPKEKGPTPVLPKDRLLADLVSECGDWIFKYFEHDSLLENVEEEELTEEERKQAWEEYENEKKGLGLARTPFLQNSFPGADGFMQNMPIQQGPVINMPNLLAMIRRENPTLSEEALVQRYKEAVLQVRSYIVRNQNVPRLPPPQVTYQNQYSNSILEQNLRNMHVQQQYANAARIQASNAPVRYPILQNRPTFNNVRNPVPVRTVAPSASLALRNYAAKVQPKKIKNPEPPKESSKDSDEVVIIP